MLSNKKLLIVAALAAGLSASAQAVTPVYVTNLPGANGQPGAGGGTPVYVTNQEALTAAPAENQLLKSVMPPSAAEIEKLQKQAQKRVAQDGNQGHKKIQVTRQISMYEVRMPESGVLCIVTVNMGGGPENTVCDFSRQNAQAKNDQADRIFGWRLTDDPEKISAQMNAARSEIARMTPEERAERAKRHDERMAKMHGMTNGLPAVEAPSPAK